MVVTDPNVEGSAPLYRQAVPCSFRITDNTLCLDNVPQNSRILLYNIQGVLCSTCDATTEKVRIALPGKGIYVVQMIWNDGATAWKIANR